MLKNTAKKNGNHFNQQQHGGGSHTTNWSIIIQIINTNGFAAPKEFHETLVAWYIYIYIYGRP